MIQRIKNRLIKMIKDFDTSDSKRFYKFWPPENSKSIPMSVFETDEEFNKLYEKAQMLTQMEDTDNAYRRQRHYTLYYLFKNALKNVKDEKKVNIAEVGCWKGLSAFHTSHTILKSGKNVDFYIFDSFQGLSAFTEKDESLTISSVNQEKMRKHFAYDFEKVKSNLSPYNFIKYFKGWVPTRFNEVEDQEFVFVHIDVDLYDPTYDCIKFFYPRLKSGGIIVFDDYGATTFLGAQKAVDDYLNSIDSSDYFFLNLPSTQAFLIKK
jgi:O-methyltransferase